MDSSGKKTLRFFAAMIATWLAVLIFTLGSFFDLNVRAEDWPYPGGSISAGAAVVIDADTGTVLWGKNQDEQYYPASITKLMTALLVFENCSLSEEVTVTGEAVYNLERGAVTAGLSVGDTLTVKDLLYATLLRSANDAANALAVHVAGSIGDFALMMTDKAAELGCKHTNFRNPSGLTDYEHMTTAYDMALIMRDLLQYDEFLEIESADTYRLSPTENYPGGLTVTMGHRMLRSGTSYSDSRVIAGKTGYITASGNTLVTAAKENGRTVICTILKGTSPAHYEDTKKLINFGLGSFENVEVGNILERFDVVNRLITDKIITGESDFVFMDGGITATLPLRYDDDLITLQYEYNLTAGAPELSIAQLKLKYEGRTVGQAYVYDEPESEVGVEDIEFSLPEAARKAIGIGLIIAIIAGVGIFLSGSLRLRAAEKEKERKRRFNARKRRRLREMGITEEQFERYMAGERMRKNQKKNQSAGRRRK